MRPARGCLLAALAATTLLPGAAAAAPPRTKTPPACDLVKDTDGDARVAGDSSGQTNDPDLDLVVADFGTNKKSFKAVWAVYEYHPIALSATGRYYELTFTAGTATKRVWVVLDSAGNVSARSGTAGEVKGNRISVTGPLATLGIAPGAVLTDFRARSERYAGQDEAGPLDPLKVDDASSGSRYTAAAPTCLSPPA